MACLDILLCCHGENTPIPSQVGILIQTSQDVLRPVGEVDFCPRPSSQLAEPRVVGSVVGLAPVEHTPQGPISSIHDAKCSKQNVEKPQPDAGCHIRILYTVYIEMHGP